MVMVAFLKAGPVFNTPPGVNANSLTLSTLAAGVSYPYSMQVLQDGSILAGISNPDASGDYLSAAGGLMRFTNPGAGGTAVYSGLTYPVQGVRALGGGLIAVAEAGTGDSEIAFLKPGADPATAYTKVGAISFSPSNAGEQFNITMAVRATPGQAGSYDLFFSMNGDTDHTRTNNFASLNGLAHGQLEYNSIAKVTVTPSGGVPAVAGLQQVARGIRNTGGMVFDPAGNLYAYVGGSPQLNVDRRGLWTISIGFTGSNAGGMSAYQGSVGMVIPPSLEGVWK